MKKVLITGASGFVGSWLLKTAPNNVEILAQYHQREIPFLPPHTAALPLNLLQPDWNPVRDFHPEVILHCAALSNPERCESQPEAAQQINFSAAARLCDLAVQIGARFIFTSTDLVYGAPRNTGIPARHHHPTQISRSCYSETDPPHPLNAYARTKLAAEHYILAHHPNAVVARCALVYGRSLHGQPTFTEAMIEHLRRGEPVTLFCDEYRTPIPVDTLAAALWELAENEFTGLINLGGAEKVSRYEMGRIICEILSLPESLLIPRNIAEMRFIAPRAPDCSLDISLARRVLKTPLPGFAEGIARIFG